MPPWVYPRSPRRALKDSRQQGQHALLLVMAALVARVGPLTQQDPVYRRDLRRGCTPQHVSLRRLRALRFGFSSFPGVCPPPLALRWRADPNGTPASSHDEGQVADGEDWFEDDDVTLLHSEESTYNHIKVLEVARYSDHPLAGARVLLLDAPGNIHSIYFRYKPWTDSYYDRFAALPPLIPRGGPIGILGLAAGSAARSIAYAWPDVKLEGWEWDPAVIEVAREFFDLRELEGAPAEGALDSEYNPLLPAWRGSRSRLRGGVLKVHQGDALGEGASVAGGFSGLVVDLFTRGVVIPQLQEEATWVRLLSRLRPGGRVMINAGGGCVESESGDAIEGERVMWATLLALRRALPEGQELLCRRLEGEGGNVMGLTVGDPSDLQRWLDCDLPAQVVDSLGEWVAFEAFIQTQIVSLEDAS